MFGLGTTELIIIFVIILLLFGAKKLPEIGKGLGGAIREFRNIKKDLTSNETGDEDESKKSTEALAEKNGPSTLEDKVVDKGVEQIPGMKEAAEVKKKAEKIKDVIKK